MSNKLGFRVYVRAEHRAYRSALLSPSVNITSWDHDANAISAKHWFRDIRHAALFTVPFNKISLIHYYNNSETRHHKFALLNGSDIHVVRMGNNDGDVRFVTYYTGTSDSDYANEHMTLDLNLGQVQALVLGFSNKEGFLCVKCKNSDSLIPSFKHMTNVKDLDDAEAVDALWDIMNDINNQLRQLKCRMNAKTGRIEALVDSSNLFPGPPCNRRLTNKNTGPRTIFRRDDNDDSNVSIPISLKRKADDDDGYFSDLNLDEIQKDAEMQSERDESENGAGKNNEGFKSGKSEDDGKNNKIVERARDFWLRVKVAKKTDDREKADKESDTNSVGGVIYMLLQADSV